MIAKGETKKQTPRLDELPSPLTAADVQQQWSYDKEKGTCIAHTSSKICIYHIRMRPLRNRGTTRKRWEFHRLQGRASSFPVRCLKQANISVGPQVLHFWRTLQSYCRNTEPDSRSHNMPCWTFHFGTQQKNALHLQGFLDPQWIISSILSGLRHFRLHRRECGEVSEKSRVHCFFRVAARWRPTR